jgi:transcriptional regulator with XRE-family HTH domain
MSAFGDELKRRRLAEGMTLEMVSAAARVSKNYIRRIEEDEGHSVTGKPHRPSLAVIDRLASAVDWPVEDARLATIREDAVANRADRDPVYARIGAKLREQRLHLGYTLEELGTYLGISAVGYGGYERGESSIPVANLVKLARKLRMPVEWFLGEMEEHDAGESELLAFYRGAAPEIQGAARLLLRAAVMDIERQETTVGRKAE